MRQQVLNTCLAGVEHLSNTFIMLFGGGWSLHFVIHNIFSINSDRKADG